jgi:hypothetical protein
MHLHIGLQTGKNRIALFALPYDVYIYIYIYIFHLYIQRIYFSFSSSLILLHRCVYFDKPELALGN